MFFVATFYILPEFCGVTSIFATPPISNLGKKVLYLLRHVVCGVNYILDDDGKNVVKIVKSVNTNVCLGYSFYFSDLTFG